MRSGGLIVYPTDSCYALGFHIGDKGPIREVRRIRQDDKNHNFGLICRDLSEIATYARIDNWHYRMLKAHTPGPYAFILKASRSVPRRLQNERRKTIGIRVPEGNLLTTKGAVAVIADGVSAAEAGKDLGQRAMITLGGNGPLHATRVAEKAGVAHIIVPPNPSVGSAVGFLSAPVSFEVVRSFHTLLASPDIPALSRVLAEMEDEARSVVEAAGDAPPRIIRRAFLRYRGQGHEIDVAMPDGAVSEAMLTTLAADFAGAYAAQFSRIVPGMAIEALNWSVSAEIPANAPAPTPPLHWGAAAPPVGERAVRMGGETVSAALHHREALQPGAVAHGPALILEHHTTTHVGPGWRAAMDASGALHLMKDAP